jgi:hypothetical protein
MGRRRGYAGIEVILVMLLLLVVAFLIFATVSAGSKAYLNLSESQKRDADLRVGMSFLDVKLKKSDVAGSVQLVENPFGTGQAFRIRSEFDGQSFFTWIYCQDGGLFELFLRADAAPSAATAGQIARIDHMDITKTGANLLQVVLELDPAAEGAAGARIAGTFFLKTGVS